MIDPKAVALKLMDIREECQYCTHWEETLQGDYGWCEKLQGTQWFPNDTPRTEYFYYCPKFSPKRFVKKKV